MTDIALLVLNGPGLAGSNGADGNSNITLKQIEDECKTLCDQLEIGLEFQQTADAKELSRWIVDDSDNFDALIINPTTVVEPDMSRSAIDALASLKKPLVEVHVNNIFRDGDGTCKPLRGPEGQTGFVCGLGLRGYLLAIKSITRGLQS